MNGLEEDKNGDDKQQKAPMYEKRPSHPKTPLTPFEPQFFIDDKPRQDNHAHHIIFKLRHQDHKRYWNQKDPPNDVHALKKPSFCNDCKGKNPDKCHEDVSKDIQGCPYEEHPGHIDEHNGDDILGKAKPEGGKPRFHGV